MLLLAQQFAKWTFQLQTKPLFEHTGIPLAVMGMLVVFAALVILSLFITALPRIMMAWAQYHPEQARHEPPVGAVASDGLSDEMLAVIAAAVNETIDQPHRIVHTRQLTSADLAWALEGRRQHHSSHKTQPRDH